MSGRGKGKARRSSVRYVYLTALLQKHGVDPASAARWDVGQIIDYCCEYNRLQKIANGIDVNDTEEQYHQLKAILPMVEKKYKNGQISREKYEEFVNRLDEYERG